MPTIEFIAEINRLSRQLERIKHNRKVYAETIAALKAGGHSQSIAEPILETLLQSIDEAKP